MSESVTEAEWAKLINELGFPGPSEPCSSFKWSWMAHSALKGETQKHRDLAAEIERLREHHIAECNRQEAEIEKLKAEIARMKGHSWCLYCGKEYSLDCTGEELQAHILLCEKHPVAKMTPIFIELRPWAKRIRRECRGGSPMNHTALDGCGPIVREDRCAHGALRYPRMVDRVLEVLGEEEDRREMTQSGKEDTTSSEKGKQA